MTCTGTMQWFTKALLTVVLLSCTAVVTHAAGYTEAHDAAVAGGEYLLAAIKEDGSFVYERNAVTGEARAGYNILRHAGTTYSLLELYKATQDARFLAGAEQGLAYLRRQIERCPGEWGVVMDDVTPMCVVERGDIKLGGNGLALLAFVRHAELTGSLEDLELMRGLAQWIVDVQAVDGDERGRFVVHKMDDVGQLDELQSLFYPGEAMYGLMRLYQLTEDEQYLDAVRNGVRYLMRIRNEQSVFELPHDHWLLYAMRELDAVAPDPEVVRHVVRYVWAMVLKQNREGVEPLEDDGAWGARGGVSSASTRLEGLGAAASVLERDGAFPHTLARLQEAMGAGVDFLLRTQYAVETPGVAARAVGGWPNSLYDPHIRIDMVQHALSALLLQDARAQARE